jgi:Spy/CpxP family protein refolding chaperone
VSWKIVLYATLIFVAGLLIGAVGSPFLARAFLRPPSPAAMSDHLFKRLEKDLALTPEQGAQIKPLIDQMSSQMNSIRSDTSKQISDSINETNSKIAEFLTPEQKTKLDQLEAERRKHLRREIPFLPPPSPH